MGERSRWEERFEVVMELSSKLERGAMSPGMWITCANWQEEETNAHLDTAGGVCLANTLIWISDLQNLSR